MNRISPFFYFFPGLFFGMVLLRAEVISWFRIQEMFHFQSFHMYGTIGSAVAVGVISILLMKYFKAKSIDRVLIAPRPSPLRLRANVIGGLLFGCGWALTGACPGPIYALIGERMPAYVLIFIGAGSGSLIYDLMKNRLPE